MKKKIIACHITAAYVPQNGAALTFYVFDDREKAEVWAVNLLRTNPANQILFAETTDVATVKNVPLKFTPVEE